MTRMRFKITLLNWKNIDSSFVTTSFEDWKKNDFCEKNEADKQVTIEIFSLSHIDLFEEILKNEFSLSNFKIVNSWCFDSIVRKIENIKTKKHWFDSFFVDFDITLNVSIERFELFCEMISKAIWLCKVVNEIRETCKANVSIIVDCFFILHEISSVRNEKFELLIENFWTKVFWCSEWDNRENENSETKKHWVDKLFIDCDAILIIASEKFELENEMTVSKRFVDSNTCFRDFANEVYETDESKKRWIDELSVDSDMYSSVKNEKLKNFDEMIDSKIDANSNVWLNVANFRSRIFWSFDSNVENEIHETKKHWIDSFFIDCNALLIVVIEKIELVDKIIVSKVISDSNTCFRDVAKKTSDSYKANESNKQMTVDFFTISHVDLTVLIMRFELLIDFFACWLRTWLRNLFLKLNFWSHFMQIIFEILTFANETFAKSTSKFLIHSLNDVDFMIVCLSN